MTGEVNMRIVIKLPKPFRSIVISADAYCANEFAGILMPGFENAVEGNAVVSVQLAPPKNVSVLLLSVQAHIKN